MSGVFYGIGVGPGDPELLTIKAIHAIEKVDVLIAPKTEKKDGSVALTIAKPYLKKDVEIVYHVFPMVKDFADSTEAWEANKAEILGLLKSGKNVAFLTLGDPMFYSTYIYVYRLLEHEGIDIETIPGIPAFAAIGSKLGYPIVEGNDILSVIPATADMESIRKAVAASDNVVLMKVYKNFPEIANLLEENGMAEHAVMVSRCGLPDERRIDDIAAHKNEPVNYLSTILTRKNVG
ncbi:MAG: precorrin-2 C(20)-methyltransferase [Selenomonadaceae bacterium]|nr:precorrin-2 C(20)-methyltransferase [Selenomonadaceae bacterium]